MRAIRPFEAYNLPYSSSQSKAKWLSYKEKYTTVFARNNFKLIFNDEARIIIENDWNEIS